MIEWMKRISPHLDSPLAPLFITTIVLTFFTFSLLNRAGFNATYMVMAGIDFCDPAAVPRNLLILQNSADSGGYDGQFYYRLALDPFTSKRVDFGITLDNPPYRHQRILYPFMAWAMSAGNAYLAPWAMLFINFSALCLLGWLGGIFAQTFKQHALWGLFLPLYPGSLMSLRRDLTEPLEIFLLVGSLLLLQRGKPIWGAILITLAVLARETALLVAGAAMLAYVFDWRRGEQKGKRWCYFTAPIVIFLIWQTALRLNWGEFPSLSGRGNLGVPFLGIASFILDKSAFQTWLLRNTVLQLILLTVFVFSVIWLIRSTAASLTGIFSWLLYLTFVLSLTRFVWLEDWAYLRALSELCALGVMIIIGANTRAKAAILGSYSILWLFIFLSLLRHGA